MIHEYLYLETVYAPVADNVFSEIQIKFYAQLTAHIWAKIFPRKKERIREFGSFWCTDGRGS